jgi:hypothetical protein
MRSHVDHLGRHACFQSGGEIYSSNSRPGNKNERLQSRLIGYLSGRSTNGGFDGFRVDVDRDAVARITGAAFASDAGGFEESTTCRCRRATGQPGGHAAQRLCRVSALPDTYRESSRQAAVVDNSGFQPIVPVDINRWQPPARRTPRVTPGEGAS